MIPWPKYLAIDNLNLRVCWIFADVRLSVNTRRYEEKEIKNCDAGPPKGSHGSYQAKTVNETVDRNFGN
jgi:hypothetical protein